MIAIETTFMAILLHLLWLTPITSSATLQLAQTHVFDAPARQWALNNKQQELHLVSLRKALAIVSYASTDEIPATPSLTLTYQAHPTNFRKPASTTINLLPPSDFPSTNGDLDPFSLDDGSKFTTTAYHVLIDADHILPGLQVSIERKTPLEATLVNLTNFVGCPTPFKILVLPFYFYGANETTKHGDLTLDVGVVGSIPKAKRKEFYVSLPLFNFTAELHPARKFQHRDMILKPSSTTDKRGIRISSRQQRIDSGANGYAIMGRCLDVLRILELLDGNQGMAYQYYGSLVMAKDDTGAYKSPGGGLGGGHRGVGDYSFGGIFFHEQGHAFGLPHWAASYTSSPQTYPYPNGGLNGSGWAFDEHQEKMIDVFAHGTMSTTEASCRTDDAWPKDAHNRCYKQDPMQSGHANRDAGRNYQIFSDFSVSVIQQYFEGAPGKTNGRIFNADDLTSLPAGFVNNVNNAGTDPHFLRWSKVHSQFVPVPMHGNDVKTRRAHAKVPMVKVIVAIDCYALRCYSSTSSVPPVLDTSGIGTMGSTTLIYQVFEERDGTMRRSHNVDDPTAMQHIAWSGDISVSPYRAFSSSGVDFFCEILFNDGTRTRVAIDLSFRKAPNTHIDPNANDPTHATSQKWGGCAALVPTGSPTLAQVDLFFAPLVWNGVHARRPQLIATWKKQGDVLQLPKVEIPTAEELKVGNGTTPFHTFYYDISIPTGTKDACAVATESRGLAQALERAVFNEITSTATATAVRVPPATEVKVSCSCIGNQCNDGCTSSYIYPSTYTRNDSVIRPFVNPFDVPSPVCGCSSFFEQDSKFNYTTNTCGSGYTHLSALTKVQLSESVYYYVDDQERPMWPGNDNRGNSYVECRSGSRSGYLTDMFHTAGVTCPDRTLEEAILACSNDKACNMVYYEHGRSNDVVKKYTFSAGSCVSPCFQHDYYGRKGYYVDNYINPFSVRPPTLAASTQTSSASSSNSTSSMLTFRLSVQSPGKPFVQFAYKHLAEDVLVVQARLKTSLATSNDFKAAWPIEINETSMSVSSAIVAGSEQYAPPATVPTATPSPHRGMGSYAATPSPTGTGSKDGATGDGTLAPSSGTLTESFESAGMRSNFLSLIVVSVLGCVMVTTLCLVN